MPIMGTPADMFKLVHLGTPNLAAPFLTMGDHTCRAVVHGDYYVIINVYLHKTPVSPSPWKGPVT